jgi:hypothetical protein
VFRGGSSTGLLGEVQNSEFAKSSYGGSVIGLGGLNRSLEAAEKVIGAPVRDVRPPNAVWRFLVNPSVARLRGWTTGVSGIPGSIGEPKIFAATVQPITIDVIYNLVRPGSHN